MRKPSENKINTNTTEINITFHCNLSCRSCSHFSPISSPYFSNAEQIHRDLTILSKIYQSEHIRLLGGEPTLHPQLLNIITAIRESGITKKIHLITNGVNLWKMPDEIWQVIDEIHISIYPKFEMNNKHRIICEEKSSKYNVGLTFSYFDRFRESYSETPNDNKWLIKRIYNSCLISHQWRCYTIHNGYFYKCPSALFIPKFTKNNSCEKDNGIKIELTTELFENLQTYINNPIPLPACTHCLGSIGKLFSSEQVRRNQWRMKQEKAFEQYVDYEYLNILETQDIDADNLCLRSHLKDPDNFGRNILNG